MKFPFISRARYDERIEEIDRRRAELAAERERNQRLWNFLNWRTAGGVAFDTAMLPDAYQPRVAAATPVPESANRKAAFFKTNDPGKLIKYEANLKQIWKLHTDDWGVPYRQVLREILKVLEYRNGNQHIGWDPLTCSYVGYNDIIRSSGWNSGTEQGKSDYTPQKNVNIIDWLCRVWCSTLGAAIPGVEWWPGDSDSDLDAKAAVARDRAYNKIASDNKDKDFLEQCQWEG